MIQAGGEHYVLRSIKPLILIGIRKNSLSSGKTASTKSLSLLSTSYKIVSNILPEGQVHMQTNYWGSPV
jgi:hypothetical protein